MTLSRLHHGAHDEQSFERARVSRATFVMLIMLRCYAVAAIGITVYAFIRALH